MRERRREMGEGGYSCCYVFCFVIHSNNYFVSILERCHYQMMCECRVMQHSWCTHCYRNSRRRASHGKHLPHIRGSQRDRYHTMLPITSLCSQTTTTTTTAAATTTVVVVLVVVVVLAIVKPCARRNRRCRPPHCMPTPVLSPPPITRHCVVVRAPPLHLHSAYTHCRSPT